jgi:hypothetical protein
VVEAAVPAGWSENSKSTASLLILNGPDSASLGLQASQVSSSTTLETAIQALESSLEQDGTGAKVCAQPAKTSIPGGLSGTGFAVCLTETSQGSAATPIEVVDLVALEQGASSNTLFLVEMVFPQSLSTSQLKNDYNPVLTTVRWASAAKA